MQIPDCSWTCTLFEAYVVVDSITIGMLRLADVVHSIYLDPNFEASVV